MRFLPALHEPVREALRSLRAHKVRSLLTTLGIVIGVAAVVAVIHLNKSLEGRILADIQSEGTHTFWLGQGMSSEAWRKGLKTRRMPLNDDSIRDLRELVPEIRRTAVQLYVGGQSMVRFGAYRRRGSIQAVDENYLDMQKLELALGRDLTAMDRSFGTPVAVLGARVAAAMGLDTPAALGRSFTIGGLPVEVIGVLKPKGDIPFLPKDEESADWSTDGRIYIPVGSLKSLTPPWARDNRYYTLQVDSRLSALEAEEKVRQALRMTRGLMAGDPDNFFLQGNRKFIDKVEKVTGSLLIASAVLVGISMLVGGIGVMNIMLVSVTERTREIGIRKALGARRRVILTQFLVEAALLCALGGLIGLALGSVGGALLGRLLMEFMASTPLWSVLAALAVPVGVGLVFGLYPALRASRLDPIEALRAE
jgi:putative ABC transport system permease protein